jgi:hypothetical protein
MLADAPLGSASVNHPRRGYLLATTRSLTNSRTPSGPAGVDPRPQDDGGAELLAQRLVGLPDHRGLEDGRALVEHLLDLKTVPFVFMHPVIVVASRRHYIRELSTRAAAEPRARSTSRIRRG